MSSFQKMVTFYVVYTISTTYSINITRLNSHSVTTTETHNICIVIAIWAPIMLVSLVGLVPLLWLSHFCAFSSFHSYDLSIYRFILWMLKFGMGIYFFKEFKIIHDKIACLDGVFERRFNF